MAWTVTINSTDYTSSVDMKSVRITNQDNFANSVSLSLVTNTTNIKAGMEIIIKEGTTVKFGGLIQAPKKILLSPTFVLLQIKSEGYKQILGRRTFQVDAQDELAGDIVSQIFTDFISTTSSFSEGLTEGNIADGVTVENYVIPAMSATKIFNDLADASGFKWWVTNEKEFYFQATPTYTDNTTTKKLTTDKEDSAYIECIDMPQYDEDTSRFRTRQFVVGKTEGDEVIVGAYVDADAETEMASRYGSGVYGAVITNDNISTVADAEALAEAEVKSYVNPATINFKTYDDIDVLELIKVDISVLGISDETYKTVKVVKTFDHEEKVISDVTIEKYVTTNKQKRVWTDEFNEMMKVNKGSNSRQLESRFLDLAYHNDENTTAVTTNIEVATLDVTLKSTGSIIVYGTFVGTATVATTLTTLIKLDTVTQHTIVDYVPGAFDGTVNYSVVLENLDAGTYTISTDMASSAGTFTLDANEQHMHALVYYEPIRVTIPTSYGTYELLADTTISSATTQVDFTGLSLTSDDEILLVADVYNPTGTESGIALTFNGNTTLTNYYRQVNEANGSTLNTFRSNSPYVITLDAGFRNITLTNINITGGGYITSQTNASRKYGTSSIRLFDAYMTTTYTVSSLTSISFTAVYAATIGVGSRFQLYRKAKA